MPEMKDARLLVGFETSDDGAVFQIREDYALIQTLDFFTPIVDDPYDFGAIAAANALSDVYAMGGKPLTAMSIVCFPYKDLPVSLLAQISKGGAETILQADALVIGGHSVSDSEIKFGYAVTGHIHPDHIWRNHTPNLGDSLVLSKPLGTGLLTTAVKQNHLPETVLETPIREMKRLNQVACDLARNFTIHAATDITGFGLLGHLYEMIRIRNFGVKLRVQSLPLFEGVWQAIESKCLTRAHTTNFAYISPYPISANAAFDAYRSILLDPQTSGGLLFALPKDQAEILVKNLNNQDHTAAVIGEITQNPGFDFE